MPEPISSDPGRAMIEVLDLVKVYGPTRAVDSISFRVEQGEILGFLGPNGAGKTTTMRILTGYTPPTSGTARIAGFDVRTEADRTRRAIGYLPESAPLYRDMETREYLAFMGEVKGLRGRARAAAVDEAISECGLQAVVGRTIRNLSKGYRQRVGLAQALLGNPPVLVLDEPTVGLDPRQIVEIRELIKGMAGRRTVILSTHILPEVSATCGKVVIINQGRIEAQGTPESLVSRLGGGDGIELTVQGAAETAEAALRSVAGVARLTRARELGPLTAVWSIEPAAGADPRGAAAAAIVGAGLELLELKSTGMTLEDIFLRTISRQREEVA
jgi:ABC-2 type transport system ATP-binding protein